jgi:hypothetical protein
VETPVEEGPQRHHGRGGGKGGGKPGSCMRTGGGEGGARAPCARRFAKAGKNLRPARPQRPCYATLDRFLPRGNPMAEERRLIYTSTLLVDGWALARMRNQTNTEVWSEPNQESRSGRRSSCFLPTVAMVPLLVAVPPRCGRGRPSSPLVQNEALSSLPSPGRSASEGVEGLVLKWGHGASPCWTICQAVLADLLDSRQW